MTALPHERRPDDVHDDRAAAAEANIPVSAANEEEAERRNVRALKHRLRGGNR